MKSKILCLSALMALAGTSIATAQKINGRPIESIPTDSLIARLGSGNGFQYAAVIGASLRKEHALTSEKAADIVARLTSTALNSRISSTRLHAANALTMGGSGKGVPEALERIMESSNDPVLKMVLLAEVPKMPNSSWRKRMLLLGLGSHREAHEESSSVGQRAVDAAVQLGAEGIAILREALKRGQIADEDVAAVTRARLTLLQK